MGSVDVKHRVYLLTRPGPWHRGFSDDEGLLGLVTGDTACVIAPRFFKVKHTTGQLIQSLGAVRKTESRVNRPGHLVPNRPYGL